MENQIIFVKDTFLKTKKGTFRDKMNNVGCHIEEQNKRLILQNLNSKTAQKSLIFSNFGKKNWGDFYICGW